MREALPGQPHDGAAPVFGAPWQAQAFALAVALHERGVFSWPEWAQALAAAIRRAPAAEGEDAGTAYYRQWLDALQALVLAKGLGSARALAALEQAWADAAERTPHGQPLALRTAERRLARQD